MSSDDGMDSLLECIIPGARGFLLLHPIVVDTYPHRGASGYAEARVPFPGSWVRRTGGQIPSNRAKS
jgi:hypothetical protein